MLILSRKQNGEVMIGDDIIVRVVEIRGDKVRLGFEAPKDVPVHRREIYDAIQRDNANSPCSLPGKFRKKPVVIEAMQYTEETRDAVIAWCDPVHTAIGEEGEVYDLLNLKINTPEGKMMACPGDWIVKGILGEFYPVKDVIFRMTYKAIGSKEAVDA